MSRGGCDSRRGGVFEVFLDGFGGGDFDAVDTVGELRLDVEHLDGAKVLLDCFARGVEEAYLFTDETADNESGFDSGEATHFHYECFVVNNGLLEGSPFGAVHPCDDVRCLALGVTV